MAAGLWTGQRRRLRPDIIRPLFGWVAQESVGPRSSTRMGPCGMDDPEARSHTHTKTIAWHSSLPYCHPSGFCTGLPSSARVCVFFPITGQHRIRLERGQPPRLVWGRGPEPGEVSPRNCLVRYPLMRWNPLKLRSAVTPIQPPPSDWDSLGSSQLRRVHMAPPPHPVHIHRSVYSPNTLGRPIRFCLRLSSIDCSRHRKRHRSRQERERAEHQGRSDIESEVSRTSRTSRTSRASSACRHR